MIKHATYAYYIIYVLSKKVKTMNTSHKINCSKCKQIVFAK